MKIDLKPIIALTGFLLLASVEYVPQLLSEVFLHLSVYLYSHYQAFRYDDIKESSN